MSRKQSDMQANSVLLSERRDPTASGGPRSSPRSSCARWWALPKCRLPACGGDSQHASAGPRHLRERDAPFIPGVPTHCEAASLHAAPNGRGVDARRPGPDRAAAGSTDVGEPVIVGESSELRMLPPELLRQAVHQHSDGRERRRLAARLRRVGDIGGCRSAGRSVHRNHGRPIRYLTKDR